MNKLIMSEKYNCFCEEFSKIGYEIIYTDTIPIFHIPEQKHADMQCLEIDENYFILNECSNLKHALKPQNPIIISQKAGKKYPQNVLLNCLYLNNTLYGKLSAVADEVKDYCNKNNIKTVNVNQGYARCSTLVIDDKAVVTADASIEKALKSNGVEVLKICEGYIFLEGFDYGFIGGTGIKIDNTIFFFGNIKDHPDFKKINAFVNRHNKIIKIICEDMTLTDIGGIIKINEQA